MGRLSWYNKDLRSVTGKMAPALEYWGFAGHIITVLDMTRLLTPSQQVYSGPVRTTDFARLMGILDASREATGT